MPRPREFDEQEVLAKALDVFWTHGYEATSITDLMEATGLAKGSIYKGFGDKKSLFMLALNNYLEAGRSRFRDKATQDRSGREVLELWLSSLSEMATCSGVRKGCMSVNCTIELAPHDDDVRKRLRQHQRQIEAMYAEVIQRGVTDGSLRADIDPATAARLLTTLINGLLVRAKLGLTKKQAKETVDMALSVLT